jgi:hypothetical protein
MNLLEFKAAMSEEFKAATQFEAVVFNEWADKVQHHIDDFGFVLRQIIKTYRYKTFPPYEVYSAAGPDVSNHERDHDNSWQAKHREDIKRYITASMSWPGETLYKACSNIQKKQNPQNKEVFLLQHWNDFYCAVGLAKERPGYSDKMADEIKRMALDGGKFFEMKNRYFPDVPPVIKPTTEQKRTNRVGTLEDLF